MTGLFLDGASLHFCGGLRRLRFDWNDLSELRAAHGVDYQEKINVALAELDFEVMASTIAIACKRAVTVDQIKSDPPAIVAAIQALNRAFNETYHGAEGAPKIARPFVRAMTKAGRSILSWIRSKLG